MLDYVFGELRVDNKPAQPTQTSSSSTDKPKDSSCINDQDHEQPTKTSGNAQLALLKKKAVLVPIANIVSLDLIGFGLTFSFVKRAGTKGGKRGLIPTLLGIDLNDLSVNLDEIGVAFEKQPVAIAGMYLHVKKKVLEYFAGGVIIRFQPWLFMADGFYGRSPPGLPPGLSKLELARRI